MAANLSGGGFSVYFERESYQRRVVNKYLRRHPDDGHYKCVRCRELGLFLLCDLCSRLGRGYPDISAQALNYKFVVKDEIFHMDGTTCSVSVRLSLLLLLHFVRLQAPQLTVNVQTAAGIISLMNDYRIFNKKPPLGFLNPWLYFRGLRGFNDIRFGANPGCNTGGFRADVGWDPVRPAALASHFR